MLCLYFWYKHRYIISLNLPVKTVLYVCCNQEVCIYTDISKQKTELSISFHKSDLSEDHFGFLE